MTFITRRLTAGELQSATQLAREKVGSQIEIVNGKYGDRATIRAHPQIIIGGKQLIVPLGTLSTRSKIPLVVKFRLPGEGVVENAKGIEIASAPLHMAMDELTADYLRHLGFPVVPHHLIGEIARSQFAIVSIDLGHGARLHEADGFDFSQLKNGTALQKEFKEYVSQLDTMRTEEKLVIDGHWKADDPQLALRRTFLIQERQGKGRLAMADLDQIKFSFADCKVDPKFAQLLREYEEHTDHLISVAISKRDAGRFVVVRNTGQG